MGVTHTHVLPGPDGSNPNRAQPSDWNAAHTITTITATDITADSLTFNDEALDEYDEGIWTPAITAATPGDLSVSYSAQTGYYTRIGNLVTVHCICVTSAFTHSTAIGAMRITGLPFAVSFPLLVGAAVVGDSNAAAYTSFMATSTTSQTYVYFLTQYLANQPGTFNISHITSGQTPRWYFTFSYRTT